MGADILTGLNPKQREAALCTDGPVLVIAGAGSGKTRALTHRLAHLIHTGIRSRNIVALTFTNKAAGEMKERVLDLLSRGTRLPFIGTFHAFGARILREDGFGVGVGTDFVIYDTRDQRALIKELMANHNVPNDRWSPGAVHATISRAKNELVTPAAFATGATTYYEKVVAPLYEAYENALREANAVDFDDLLVLPVRLLREKADVLEKYQRRYTHFLVDEYQDTNHAQYALLHLLAAKHRNLCVVGDDWQSIYRFRGADFRNILHFERDWPEATVVFLEENYRSSQPILDAAQSVIEQNQFRTHKKLWTARGGSVKPRIVQLDDELTEGIWVLDEVERLVSASNGLPAQAGPRTLEDVVVLYRTNAQSRIFEELLVGRGIPYAIIGSVRFYERKEIKDIVAYLRLLHNPRDLVSLRRVANTPPRGIGAKTLEKLLDRSFDNMEHVKIRAFEDLLESLRTYAGTASLEDVVKKLLARINYRAYLGGDSGEGEERWENVQELVSVTAAYGSASAKDALPTFLEEVALLSPTDEVGDRPGALNLMTLHAVKGLEFNTVFIVGCEDGLLPHEKSVLSQEEMEEERRLLYVGMTRAKERLIMTFARRRTLFGSSSSTLPSRFLSDIPEELVEFSASGEEAIETIEL